MVVLFKLFIANKSPQVVVAGDVVVLLLLPGEGVGEAAGEDDAQHPSKIGYFQAAQCFPMTTPSLLQPSEGEISSSSKLASVLENIWRL